MLPTQHFHNNTKSYQVFISYHPDLSLLSFYYLSNATDTIFSQQY